MFKKLFVVVVMCIGLLAVVGAQEAKAWPTMAVMEATIPRGGPWSAGTEVVGELAALPAITPSELASIRQDAHLMGLIALSHHWSLMYLGEIDPLSGLIDDILDLIVRDLDDLRGTAS